MKCALRAQKSCAMCHNTTALVVNLGKVVVKMGKSTRHSLVFWADQKA